MGDTQDRPVYRVLSTRAIVVAAFALLLVGTGTAAWLLLTFGGGTEADRARLEAIKTAGTIVVGTGGAAALWLAARRQQTTEIALRQRDIDQAHQEQVAAATQAHQDRVATATEIDSAERRVTDLYIKAVEQLGSDKALVRLGGMYALERLAQNVPDQRQTIVNVLCAYLRTPHSSHKQLPTEISSNSPSVDSIPIAANRPEETSTTEAGQYGQDHQVRLTAERILFAHLIERDYEQERPRETYWKDIDLDLTGATLFEANLASCHIRSARFNGAHFAGQTRFDGAKFDDQTEFNGAKFMKSSSFEMAKFLGATFFRGAEFHGEVDFGCVKFDREAEFDGSEFRATADFHRSSFNDDAFFSGVKFDGKVDFSDANIDGNAWFHGATFGSGASFNRVIFEWVVHFDGAKFSQKPGLNDARVRLDVNAGDRIWPDGFTISELGANEDLQVPNRVGRWGRLTAIDGAVTATDP
ncbi:pentapeptide repeat-containing protein [Lentzea sp. NPDC005914]|uniref:pentapeptide repeat-containing protein n=1 Tax=Lentzea sp. NPDC005914 TaxID=3154572 RepID=UPI0033F2C721